MKYKNYGFWTSLSASLVIMAGTLQKALNIEISAEIITNIVMGIAGVLVVFGIVKMPKEKSLTNKEEDKTEEDNQKTEQENKK